MNAKICIVYDDGNCLEIPINLDVYGDAHHQLEKAVSRINQSENFPNATVLHIGNGAILIPMHFVRYIHIVYPSETRKMQDFPGSGF